MRKDYEKFLPKIEKEDDQDEKGADDAERGNEQREGSADRSSRRLQVRKDSDKILASHSPGTNVAVRLAK